MLQFIILFIAHLSYYSTYSCLSKFCNTFLSLQKNIHLHFLALQSFFHHINLPLESIKHNWKDLLHSSTL